MSPLFVGAIIGALAGLTLTVAIHRLTGKKAFCALVATIFLSMLPRVFYGLAANDSSADVLYVLGWMIFISAVFFPGWKLGGRFLKKRQKP